MKDRFVQGIRSAELRQYLRLHHRSATLEKTVEEAPDVAPKSVAAPKDATETVPVSEKNVTCYIECCCHGSNTKCTRVKYTAKFDDCDH